MKRLLLALLGLALGSSAFAADMPPPRKAPPPAPVAAASGAGFYIGLHAGGATTTGKFDWLVVPGTGSLHPSGGLVGGTVGFGGFIGTGIFVAAEVDGDWDLTKQNTSCAFILQCEMKASWLSTQGIVLGIPLGAQAAALAQAAPSNWPFPASLPASAMAAAVTPFVTAGIGERSFKACVSGQGCGHEIIVGPMVGGGLNIPIAQSVSAQVKYRYIKYNKNFVPASTTPIFDGSSFKATSEQALTAGIVFHL